MNIITKIKKEGRLLWLLSQLAVSILIYYILFVSL